MSKMSLTIGFAPFMVTIPDLPKVLFAKRIVLRPAEEIYARSVKSKMIFVISEVIFPSLFSSRGAV